VEIQLSWEPVAGASGYWLYRSDTAAGTFVYIGSSTGLSYSDAEVTAESVWYYKVSAFNSNQAESLQSESVAGKVPLKITSFSFTSPAAAGNIEGTTISVTIPSVVNISSLVPSIGHTGFSISPAASVPQDFSSPVSYTVTAQNGTTKDYTVNITVADPTLLGALTWLGGNAVSGGEYNIKLQDDESLAPRSLAFAGESDINITIEGGDTEKTLTLNRQGSLFTVGSGVNVTLNGKITMTGWNSNTSALITVNSGGTLTINDGVKITDNVNSGDGGGVSVSGTFTMKGGEISTNSAQNGGGVYVASGGVFTKSGGVIFGSDASGTSKNTASDSGSAVYAGTNKIRNYGAAAAVGMDSSKSGMAGGFEGPVTINVGLNQNEWNLLTQTQTVELGTSISFTVNGSYAYYQWYLDGVPDGNGAGYTFSATGAKTAGVYELIVLVRSTDGEERSGRRRITVHEANAPILSPIEIQLKGPEDWNLLPQNRNIGRNTLTQFNVEGSYQSYQWYLDGSPVGTGSSYSFDSNGKQGGEVYELTAVVTNSAGEARAGNCRITIINDPAPEDEKPRTAAITLKVNLPVEWDLLSQNQSVAKNTSTEFFISGAYTSCQWYLDGSPVGTGSSYSFNSAGTQGGEVYELAVVASSAGEQRSGRCRITVIKDPVPQNEKPQAALIILGVNAPSEWDLLPQSLGIAQNTVTQFDTEESYAAYRWYVDGSPVSTASSYSFDSAGKQAGAVYELSVVVTGGNSEQRSGRCRITIQN
jgi:hypothetical protein